MIACQVLCTKNDQKVKNHNYRLKHVLKLIVAILEDKTGIIHKHDEYEDGQCDLQITKECIMNYMS